MSWVSIHELNDLLGAEKAKKLCEVFGGLTYYIPQKPRLGHAFYDFLGEAGLLALCMAYPSEKITLPNGKKAAPKKGEIIELLEQGKSIRETASALNVTDRWVKEVARGVRPAARQLNLFQA